MGSFVAAAANGGNVSTLTGVTWPAHTGDDLAILVWTFQNTSVHTDPAGFTLVGTLDDGACRSRVYKRIPADMTGSESGDVSLVQDTINRQSAVLYVVTGFSDVAGSASFAETVAGTTHDCPQVTFTGNCNTLVAVSERLSTGTTNATAPTGYTEHVGSEFGTGGTGGTYTGVADDGLATAVASPVDPGAWTGHVSGGTAVTWTVALTPTASGATVTPAVTATLLAVPQATPLAGGNATATPATVTAAVAAPQASPSGASATSPAVTVSTTSLPQAERSGGATASPAHIQAAVAAPPATPTVSDTATPGFIATVVAFLQGLFLGGTTASPQAIDASVAVPVANPTRIDVETPTGVTLAVRSATSSATPRDSETTATARQYVSTATARSPQ